MSDFGVRETGFVPAHLTGVHRLLMQQCNLRDVARPALAWPPVCEPAPAATTTPRPPAGDASTSSPCSGHVTWGTSARWARPASWVLTARLATAWLVHSRGWRAASSLGWLPAAVGRAAPLFPPGRPRLMARLTQR